MATAELLASGVTSSYETSSSPDIPQIRVDTPTDECWNRVASIQLAGKTLMLKICDPAFSDHCSLQTLVTAVQGQLQELLQSFNVEDHITLEMHDQGSQYFNEEYAGHALLRYRLTIEPEQAPKTDSQFHTPRVPQIYVHHFDEIKENFKLKTDDYIEGMRSALAYYY